MIDCTMSRLQNCYIGKNINNCPKIIEEMIFVVRLAAVETVWKNGVVSTKMSEDF